MSVYNFIRRQRYDQLMRMEVRDRLMPVSLCPTQIPRAVHVLSRSIQNAVTRRPAATVHMLLTILKIKQPFCHQATEYELTDLCHRMMCSNDLVSR